MTGEVGIIGAGPAGIAAAVQLKRLGWDVIVFEHDRIGGLVRNALLVENYPGFPAGISGTELAELLSCHLQEFQVRWVKEKVTQLDVDLANGQFNISTGRDLYWFPFVVVASGSRANIPPVYHDLPADVRSRIFFEIFPLLELKNQTIAIVGGGDVAFDYALNLGKNNDVFIFNRSRETKSLPVLFARIKENPAIHYSSSTRLLAVECDHQKRLQLDLDENGREGAETVDYLVFAIGRSPSKDFYSCRLKEDEIEWVNKGSLYLAGDVKNGSFRQVAIAVGDGMTAAMKINQILGGGKNEGFGQYR